MTDEEEVADTKQPEPPKEPSAIDKANVVLEKMEKVRDETKLWVERAEALKAEQMISGRSEAGIIPAAPKPISDKEYAAKVMRGEL
jgi:hypothetical protein